MDGKMIEKNINGDLVPVNAGGDGHIPLITDYASVKKHVEESQDRYLRYKREFFSLTADAENLLTVAKHWQRASHDYITWAGTLFNTSKETEVREEALQIMDKICKDSSLRHENILMHTSYKRSLDPNNTSNEKLDEAEYSSSAFLRNVIKTQKKFYELSLQGENYESAVMRAEIEASAHAAEMREKVLPKDRFYTPGRVYPPHRVPEGERVPYHPDVYDVYKSQPAEAYEYDYVQEEPVLKEGYVSPDGLVDRDSVIYDREKGKVTMKYRGGVPVTWEWWKPKGITDLPEEGSWVLDYQRRMYRQLEDDEEFRILHHRVWEDEVADYDRIPPGTNQ